MRMHVHVPKGLPCRAWHFGSLACLALRLGYAEEEKISSLSVLQAVVYCVRMPAACLNMYVGVIVCERREYGVIVA